MKRAVVAALVTGLMFGKAAAVDSSQLIGGSLGYGTREFESPDAQLYDGGDGVNWDIWYRFMFSEHWGAELGYARGEGGIFSALIDPVSQLRDLKYDGGRFFLVGQFPLYEGGGLYAKAGYGMYQIDYEYQKARHYTHDQGFSGVFGFQHRFKSGFGLHAEYQWTPMEKLAVSSVNLGLSWQF
ncbi:outer membrane beta-barrel protein [Shewanella sp.]|uniref:outer membrane beta-barrel protein n=1 Tax=Shewanella sp. TaxID=50422 RepID=UPI003567ABF5